jgi:hypothetical protein
MSIPACRSASFGPENLISLNRRQPFLNHLFSALHFLISKHILIQAARTIHSPEIISERIQSQVWGYYSELSRMRRWKSRVPFTQLNMLRWLELRDPPEIYGNVILYYVRSLLTFLCRMACVRIGYVLIPFQLGTIPSEDPFQNTESLSLLPTQHVQVWNPRTWMYIKTIRFEILFRGTNIYRRFSANVSKLVLAECCLAGVSRSYSTTSTCADELKTLDLLVVSSSWLLSKSMCNNILFPNEDWSVTRSYHTTPKTLATLQGNSKSDADPRFEKYGRSI